MSDVKVSTNVKFRDYLLESLQEPEAAAAYITAILEEHNPGPTLLKSALLDVMEALSRTGTSSEQAEHGKQLNEIFTQPGSEAIYGLANWLNDLGLKLTVTVADQEQE